jgi:hypothetical protein
LKDAVNRASGLPGPAKNNLKSAADAIKNRAKALESRLKDSKPATAEARQLFEAVQKFDEAVKGSPAAAPAMSLMGSMRAPLTTLRQAFGMTAAAGT